MTPKLSRETVDPAGALDVGPCLAVGGSSRADDSTVIRPVRPERQHRRAAGLAGTTLTSRRRRSSSSRPDVNRVRAQSRPNRTKPEPTELTRPGPHPVGQRNSSRVPHLPVARRSARVVAASSDWPKAGMLEGMAQDDMRASDADREVIADRLRVALGEGRLDLHEYDERLQRAYAAKTYRELNGLLEDLPSPVPVQRAQVVPAAAAQPPTGGSRPGHPDATRRWLRETWESYGAVVAVTIMVWVLSGIGPGDFQYFWPIWVAGPWGAILLWHTVTGLATGEPQRWAQKQDRKRAAKQLKKDKQLKNGGRAAPGDGAPPHQANGRTAT